MPHTKIMNALEDKYASLGEKTEVYLKGLLYAKPLNYWDYIEVDTLLTLQKPRTNFADEEIFIIYHQMTELVLKLISNEVKQLVYIPFDDTIWIDKMHRLIRYTNLLITSFDIMKDGMNFEDYNTFRNTLTPASGFQSVQFRLIEIYCTPVINLVNAEGKKRLTEKPTLEELFEQVYWKDAGHNRTTGKKSLTLTQFEEKYLYRFMALANKVKGKTIAEKIENNTSISTDLLQKLKEFDYTYNVAWPLVHLETAQHYLDKKGEAKDATGSSEWKKYLHPKYQQRIFFPTLWKENEILNFKTKN
jgi:tryptophan 2,3-dioxygenase